MSRQEIIQVEVARLEVSPFQARKRFDEERLRELAESIRQHGVLQPVLVRQRGSGYQLLAGERRVRAARLAGLTHLPAIVREASDEEALEVGLIENVQRQDISVVEAALAFRRLVEEFGYTQAEVALRTGKSRVHVTNLIRLLNLPESVLQLVDAGELTEGHARALLVLPYPSTQAEMAEWAARNAVPVRELEAKARAVAEGSRTERAVPSRVAAHEANVADLEERLRSYFGTKAVLRYNRGQGSVTLEFYSDDDLERILELLGLVEP